MKRAVGKVFKKKKKSRLDFDPTNPVVPDIVKKCLAWLEEHEAYKVEGIFRLSGFHSETLEIKEMFEKEKNPVIPPTKNAHAVACTLKMWLLELPQPLLTFDLYDTFINAWKSDPKNQKAKVMEVVKMLPPGSRNIFLMCMGFCHRIHENQETTKMGAQNLGILFSAILLRSKEENLQKILADSQVINELMTFCVLNQHEMQKLKTEPPPSESTKPDRKKPSRMKKKESTHKAEPEEDEKKRKETERSEQETAAVAKLSLPVCLRCPEALPYLRRFMELRDQAHLVNIWHQLNDFIKIKDDFKRAAQARDIYRRWIRGEDSSFAGTVVPFKFSADTVKDIQECLMEASPVLFEAARGEITKYILEEQWNTFLSSQQGKALIRRIIDNDKDLAQSLETAKKMVRDEEGRVDEIFRMQQVPRRGKKKKLHAGTVSMNTSAGGGDIWEMINSMEAEITAGKTPTSPSHSRKSRSSSKSSSSSSSSASSHSKSRSASTTTRSSHSHDTSDDEFSRKKLEIEKRRQEIERKKQELDERKRNLPVQDPARMASHIRAMVQLGKRLEQLLQGLPSSLSIVDFLTTVEDIRSTCKKIAACLPTEGPVLAEKGEEVHTRARALVDTVRTVNVGALDSTKLAQIQASRKQLMTSLFDMLSKMKAAAAAAASQKLAASNRAPPTNTVSPRDDRNKSFSEPSDDTDLPYQELVYDDGSAYYGEMKNGECHGRGKYVFPNGNVYEGQFYEGTLQGLGTLIYAKGDQYYGEWYQDKRHGTGRYTSSNGDVYFGQYEYGKKSGRGVYVLSCGDKYEGEYRNGLPNGYGIYKFANGDQFTGYFKDDMFHGEGKLVTSSGTYEGAFAFGRKHGRGRLTTANGDEYDGEFVGGEMEGQGVYRFESGDVYSGQLKAGKFHGIGRYQFASGSVIEAEFANGVPTNI